MLPSTASKAALRELEQALAEEVESISQHGGQLLFATALRNFCEITTAGAGSTAKASLLVEAEAIDLLRRHSQICKKSPENQKAVREFFVEITTAPHTGGGDVAL